MLSMENSTETTKTCGVWCILTYDGSVVDIVINYAMLAVNLWITLLVNQREGLQRWLFLPLTTFLFAFQVILCLVIGCMGISVVWSALFGYYVVLVAYGGERLILKEQVAFWFGVFTTLVTCVYYLVTDEFITTVAHLCAALMGALIGRRVLQLVHKKRTVPKSND